MTGLSIPGGRISCRFFSTDRLSADSRCRENLSAVSRAWLTESDRTREAISLTGAPTMAVAAVRKVLRAAARSLRVWLGIGGRVTPDSASTGITSRASFRATRLCRPLAGPLDLDAGLPVGLLGLDLRQSVQQDLGARGQGRGCGHRHAPWLAWSSRSARSLNSWIRASASTSPGPDVFARTAFMPDRMSLVTVA